jgi:hypothetical protein
MIKILPPVVDDLEEFQVPGVLVLGVEVVCHRILFFYRWQCKNLRDKDLILHLKRVEYLDIWVKNLQFVYQSFTN